MPAKIFHHPRLRALLAAWSETIFHANTYLGMFGALTWKPVHLVSTDPCVSGLVRTMFNMHEWLHTLSCVFVLCIMPVALKEIGQISLRAF